MRWPTVVSTGLNVSVTAVHRAPLPQLFYAGHRVAREMDALERTALEFNDIANGEYCGGAGADAPNDDMPDNAPSSGYIYSSIGGVVAAACAYLIGN